MHWGIFEILVCGASLALLVIYWIAALGQRSSGRGWGHWRTACFSGGILLVLVALSPPIAEFAHHDLRGHMTQHLLLGMIAPLGLVLGAPVTLALRAGTRGFSRVLVRILRSPVARFVSNPLIAMVLNIGGMALLYLTPLYAAMLDNAWLHALVHWHFLVAGCLFTWAIAGPDPAPHRAGFRLRLLVMLLTMGSHAFLSKAMYAYGWPEGQGTDAVQSAARIMYYGGDLAEVLLVIALFSQASARRRNAMVFPSALRS